MTLKPLKVKRGFTKEALDLLFSADKNIRKFMCSLDPKYFAIYYFPEYFDYKIPEFHYDFYEDGRKLVMHELKEAAWVGFRESAKTSLAKIILLWIICFRYRRYINVDSHSKENAENFLYDIALQLQTNQRLIEDYGHLFYRKKRKKDDDEGATMKRIGNFITENGIKLEAFSTQESTRGRIYGIHRPDFYVLDDIENDITKESPVMRTKIMAHYNELKSGAANTAGILTLGNLIIDDGVISKIMDLCEQNPESAVVRNIPVVTDDNRITWPDKYVFTDAEAAELNKSIANPRKWKVSLESKERELTTPVYMANMMNKPSKTGEYIFDRKKVDAAIERVKNIRPLKINGDLKMWVEQMDPTHAYAIGADTSEGIGRDSSTTAIFDFKINAIVATYKNNKISPNIFAWEIKRQGELFGECLVCPEINNTGWATVAELQNIYNNIYEREELDKITNQQVKKFAWKTTAGNKWKYIGDFQRAFENEEITIFDKELLEEMKHLRKSDVNIIKKTPEMTRHFDLLIAAALAWQMKTHVSWPKGSAERVVKMKSPLKGKPVQPLC